MELRRAYAVQTERNDKEAMRLSIFLAAVPDWQNLELISGIDLTGHPLALALLSASSALFVRHPNKVVEDLIMNSNEALRREILRLAKAGNHAVCIRTHQLSALYNVPEPLVRRELASLAENKLIRLSDWDGHQRRYYEHWPSAEDFVNSKSERGHCHVEILPAQEPQKLAAAAGARG